MTSQATPAVCTPGLREQKKQRTADDLRRVALEQFAARGFDAVTVDDIVAAAEVSKTTFYRYFDSKESVLLGPADELMDLVRSTLLARPDGEPPLEAVREAFLAVARHYEVERDRSVAVGRIISVTPSLAARNLEYQRAWEDLLRDYFALRDGGGEPELSHCVRAATVVASLRAAKDYWVTSDPATPLTEVVDAAMRVTVRELREARP